MSRTSQESRNNIENSQRDTQENGVVFVRISRSEDSNNTPQNWYSTVSDNDRSRVQANQEDQSSLRNVRSENDQMDEPNQNVESNSIGYYIRNQNTDEAISRSHRLENEAVYSDEETRNFGALADIRESRV